MISNKNNLVKRSSNKALTSLAASNPSVKVAHEGSGGIPVAYLKDKGLRKAYLSYYLPSNLLKYTFRSRSFPPSEEHTFKEHLRILDIGSGPGSVTLGVLSSFPDWRKAGSRVHGR
jgi:methylase of polypeptide subunit release factors